MAARSLPPAKGMAMAPPSPCSPQHLPDAERRPLREVISGPILEPVVVEPYPLRGMHVLAVEDQPKCWNTCAACWKSRAPPYRRQLGRRSAGTAGRHRPPAVPRAADRHRHAGHGWLWAGAHLARGHGRGRGDLACGGGDCTGACRRPPPRAGPGFQEHVAAVPVAQLVAAQGAGGARGQRAALSIHGRSATLQSGGRRCPA